MDVADILNRIYNLCPVCHTFRPWSARGAGERSNSFRQGTFQRKLYEAQIDNSFALLFLECHRKRSNVQSRCGRYQDLDSPPLQAHLHRETSQQTFQGLPMAHRDLCSGLQRSPDYHYSLSLYAGPCDLGPEHSREMYRFQRCAHSSFVLEHWDGCGDSLLAFAAIMETANLEKTESPGDGYVSPGRLVGLP